MTRTLIAAAALDGLADAPPEAFAFERMKRSRATVRIAPVVLAKPLRPAAPADRLPRIAATAVPLTPARLRSSASRMRAGRFSPLRAGSA